MHLDSLTKTDLKRILNARYDSITHNGWSIELHYPAFGASFYYMVKDTDETIFAMDFDSAYKGKTGRGFDIRNMTLADVIRIYGEPEYQVLPDDPTLYAHFDSAGIYFAITLRTGPGSEYKADSPADSVDEDYGEAEEAAENLAERKFYDSAYRKSKIASITVGIPGTSF